ncbi:hypothetical protein ES703_22108 [subsurface metagenome]
MIYQGGYLIIRKGPGRILLKHSNIGEIHGRW